MVVYLRREHQLEGVLHSMDLYGWCIISLIALTSMFQKACLFLAYRHETVSWLQKLAYVSSLLTFMIDVEAFNSDFCDCQVLAFCFCIGVHCLQGYLTYDEHRGGKQK